MLGCGWVVEWYLALCKVLGLIPDTNQKRGWRGVVKRRHLIVHIPSLTVNYLTVSFILPLKKDMYFMCVSVVYACVSVCHMHSMQRTLEPLELELHIVRSHPVGDRTRTWFFRKNSKCFSLLSHLASLFHAFLVNKLNFSNV